MTRAAAVAVVASILVVVAASTGAAAQEASGTTATRISITLENSPRPEIADSIAARLSDADGNPIGSAVVGFAVRTEILGGRYASIGEAVTDATGVARIQLVPHRELYETRAIFEGDDAYAATEATAMLRFRTQRVVAFESEDSTQLGGLRNVMPRAIGIVVALLWAALIGLWFVTVRKLKEAGLRARRDTEKPADGGRGSPTPEPA